MHTPGQLIRLIVASALLLVHSSCGSDDVSATADATPDSETAADSESVSDAAVEHLDATGPAGDAAEDGTEDTAEDTAPLPAPAITWDYLSHEVRLLGPGEGFDLDGDDVPDNALGELLSDPELQESFGGDPNEWLAESVADGDLALLIRLLEVHDRTATDDPSVGVEIYVGDGLDGDGAHLVSCDSYDEAGAPASLFTEATVTGGELAAGPGTFRFVMTFAANTELVFRHAHMSALVSADGAGLDDGRIGGVVVLTEIEAILNNDPELTESGKFIIYGLFESIADIDLDGDDEPDGVSAGFGVAASPAAIDTDSPCVP